MVFQNYALYPHMTVFDNMAFGLKLRKVPKETIKRKVEEAARILDISHLLDRYPKALSGGQKQRLAVATAMLSQKPLLVFDEPTSGLDYARMQEVARCARELADEGRVVLVVTHDREFLQCACDRVLEL